MKRLAVVMADFDGRETMDVVYQKVRTRYPGVEWTYSHYSKDWHCFVFDAIVPDDKVVQDERIHVEDWS